MGFLSGSASFERYWITKDDTPAFGEEHLKNLQKWRIGRMEGIAIDQPDVGFAGGAHLLDTSFELEKNVLGDAMHFGIRIDTNQIPGPIKNAWLQMELLALMEDNPGGRPTKAQRKEAKDAVEAKCEEEAATGKFRRMQQVPILWDAQTETMFIGGTGPTANEMCIDLFERSFALEFDRVSSGKLAYLYAEENDLLKDLFETSPSAFLGEGPSSSIEWWSGIADNFDYLGNEFLIWLWWYFENESDTIPLSDGSEVFGMFSKTLTLDCPLGQTGKETISSDSPVVLPEAKQAIQSGKLPRKAGLTLIRHDLQYQFTLQAETFLIGGAKFSTINAKPPASDNPDEDRIITLRDFTETLDLLFHAFCAKRIGKAWKPELAKIQQWMAHSQPGSVRKPAA
ncbi:MAG: hypothetical protein R3C28_20185 [Pirellulaceae bacterium]